MRKALVVALGLSVPALAAAQPADPPAGGEAGEGQEVEPIEEPMPEDIEGTSENPDAPRLPGDDDEDQVDPVAPPPARTGYPIEEVLRPITLPAVTSEVRLDVRAGFDPLDVAPRLRARYGITRQWQVGVRYTIGGLYDTNLADTDEEVGWNTGKGMGLDVTYLVKDWIGARVTLPRYFDPFAMGVTLGAPMKFRFGDKVAIVAGDDFLDIRVVEFVPSLETERENEFLVLGSEVGDVVSDVNVHIGAGVIYQLAPDMAVRGNFRQSFIDRDTRGDEPTLLEVIFQYSPSEDLDVTGRVGFDRLDEASETFGLIVGAQYRI